LADHPLGHRAVVLRLAGLYGPGRLPQIGPNTGQTPGPPGRLVNIIHVEDAAAVVLAAEARSVTPRTYLVSDGHPTERRRYLERLAELLGLPPPAPASTEAVGSIPRSMGDKRVSNRRMLEELRVELAYPDYWAGLAAAIAGDPAAQQP
jgi:nucleoside-diphosphate-sugar epimerase